MDFVYVYFYGNEWEDTIIFLSKEDAIKESVNNPSHRIEIFSKTNNNTDTNTSCGYTSTYNYYINGELIQCQ
jgi:hypothetical protein